MLIGWKEVALELSYMQHDISHGSFKWLDWQCQLCQAAMYKYKKNIGSLCIRDVSSSSSMISTIYTGSRICSGKQSKQNKLVPRN